ncbi:MAG: EAL domain-containing protein [Gammaproteobacteria bacterium]|jgi:diguanylate cyclase (GGDEF)-like protein|nr:EAL domain-containing protein [Gammaproteobacteria bacterium]
MTQAAIEELPATIELTDVKSEQIRILYAAIPGSLFAILVCSLILSIAQWQVVDHATIIAWFSITNLLSLLRLSMFQQFEHQQPNRLVDGIWAQRAVITSLLSGATWGIGGFFLFPEHDPAHQVFLAFVISGMCAGAITTLSSIILAARGFVIFAILPIVVKFNLIDSEFSLAMTIMSILFVAMILVSAKRLNLTILQSLEFRHQRELAEQTIRYQAQYDDLTNLPNRRLFLATLRQEMAKAERHQRYGAVFFIDLDRFKSVNDSLGHAVGDDLLIEAAQKISARLRQEDSVGRLGGDEFVVLLPEVGLDPESAGSHASTIADEMRLLFAEPFTIQGHEIHLTISIGIALFPGNVGADDLLKFADVAMYRAKSEGRDGVRLFSAEMQEAVNQQRIIEKGLRQALANSEFELYFQGQYDANNRLIGAETLLRWNHPERGVVAPGEFIHVAEQTGLIVPIGDWVLRSACEQLQLFHADLRLAVNVSPRQFSDPAFVDNLKRVLLETGADPRLLTLEITEGLAIGDIGHSITTMNALKKLGIKFSVDDFGTGYSSLSYLHQLPIDELKIDQSFVRNISTSPENEVIVDTIIVMAQQLNLTIVAEGIETPEELNYLKLRQCDYFQGYHFARPEPFAQFYRNRNIKLLSAHE